MGSMKETDNILYEESMKKTDNLLSQGYTRTVHYTTGRFGKTNLQTLYGISELPVLHNSTRLALLITREAHQGQAGVNHRKSPSDMIGRSWQYALIYKPYNLPLQVAKNCPRCSLEDAKSKRNKQKMGQVGPDCQTPSPPFSNVSADLAGPFRIKNKERKTWVLIYLSNISKALHLQPVENYTAKAIINVLNNVFGVRNLPNTIITDSGKNVTNSRKLILKSLKTGVTKKDLEEIKSTWPQINW